MQYWKKEEEKKGGGGGGGAGVNYACYNLVFTTKPILFLECLHQAFHIIYIWKIFQCLILQISLPSPQMT